METRRRKSWGEGTVTGLRGGNEKVVVVGCVSKFRHGSKIDFDWRAMLWRGLLAYLLGRVSQQRGLSWQSQSPSSNLT